MNLLVMILLAWFIVGVIAPATLGGLILLVCGPSRRVVKITATCGMAWSIVVLCGLLATAYDSYHQAWLDYQANLVLKEKYPLVSLANRLAYEASPGRERFVLPRDMFSASAIELAIQDEIHNRVTEERDGAIRALHERTLEWFIDQQDLGDDRLPAVRGHLEEFIQNTGPRSVPTPAPIAWFKYYDRYKKYLKNEPYLQFHIDGLIDLFNSSRDGYVIDKAHVAGFESHRLTEVPEFKSPDQASSPISLIRLELVSLLRHAEPVAYVSHTLPNLERLHECETRKLSEFEKTGLSQMKSHDDISTSRSGDRVQMIGSIRARKSCLVCHEAQEGELLGALTYEFQVEKAE